MDHITNRQPKFQRHLIQTFDLKAAEAHSNVHPGVAPVWVAQPIGISRYPVSAMKLENYSRSAGINLNNVAPAVPSAYNLEWRRTATGVVSAFTGIPSEVVVELGGSVSIEVTPTGPMTIEVTLNTVAVAVLYQFIHVFNPISGDAFHFKTPYLYDRRISTVGIRVSNDFPAGQAVEFNLKLCLFPTLEVVNSA